MAGRVHNALGGTPDDPCPTDGASFCTIGDYRSWRDAVGLLYELGLAPTWATLANAAPKIDDVEARELLGGRVQAYVAQFNALPRTASLFSYEENLQRVDRAVVLMNSGDVLLDELIAAVDLAGATPPTLTLPAAPAQPKRKSRFRKYWVPAAFGVGVFSVIGLTAWAAMSPRGAADGRVRNGA